MPKFNIKAHEAKMMMILNPPPSLVTQTGMPNLSEQIKTMGKKVK